jgi:DNA (cytosine-5)-methyltransferase 1
MPRYAVSSHGQARPINPRSRERGELSDNVCLFEWISGRRPRGCSRPWRTFRIVDVFAGCGGMTLGAMEAARKLGCGAEIALAVDLDPDALSVYRANFGVGSEVALQADMGRMFHGRLGAPLSAREAKLRGALGPIDVLLAGPPCQGYSNLNNNTRRDDPRNRLYRRAVRAAEILKPDVILIENVPSILLDKRDVVARAKSTLEAAGYDVATYTVDASDLGIPQRRRRHVLLAARRPLPEASPYERGLRSSTGCLSYLADTPQARPGECAFIDEQPRYSPSTQKRIAYLFERGVFDLPDRRRPICHQGDHRYKSMYGRLRPDRPAQTITSGFACMGQGRFVHPRERRTLTAREAARLQGLPDFHLFKGIRSRDALRRMIGNAVVPRVVALPLLHIWQEQLAGRPRSG